MQASLARLITFSATIIKTFISYQSLKKDNWTTMHIPKGLSRNWMEAAVLRLTYIRFSTHANASYGNTHPQARTQGTFLPTSRNNNKIQRWPIDQFEVPWYSKDFCRYVPCCETPLEIPQLHWQIIIISNDLEQESEIDDAFLHLIGFF